jgi:DNA-binding response OmpR family regulator
MQVLVVEDDPKVANALREGLVQEGHSVVVESTGDAALTRIEREPFDIILLDLTLPGRDGLHILRVMRERGLRTPVLVLTARDMLEDRVLGLDTGADDYLVKPFAFAEVLARMRALVRRGRPVEPEVLSLGALVMDLAARTVVCAGRPIELTVREFELLEYLLRHEGQVVSRDGLAREVWKESSRSVTLNNVIDVHMTRLRRKLDADAPLKWIQTVRGVGFVMRGDEG